MALILSTAPVDTRVAVLRRRPAIFIDKDGTLVRDVPYNVDPARVQFTDGALDALAELVRRGYRIVVVSNQPGLALGLFALADLQRLAGWIAQALARRGVPLDGFYACPHAPAPLLHGLPPCGCRKPAPGMLLRAAREQGVDLRTSWMIGDILDDVEAGARAGVRTVLLDVGNETEWRQWGWRRPTLHARSFAEAAERILEGTPSVRARGGRAELKWAR